MWEIFQIPEARWVMLAAGLGILLLIGVYLIRKVRPSEEEQFSASSELITNSRELHAQGELSDEEYRTIKSKLAGDLEQELRRATEEDTQQDTTTGEAN